MGQHIGHTGSPGFRRLDLRDMRREKRRRAYVCWIEGDACVYFTYPVERWAVLRVERDGEVREVWQPAFWYVGGWCVPEFWAESWPERALVVADPGVVPSSDTLERAARALVRPTVHFVPGPWTAQMQAEQVQAAEDAARRRAYPPARPTPTPADREGWWEPANDAEWTQFLALIGPEFESDSCLRSGRSGHSGRFSGSTEPRELAGTSGTSGTKPENTGKSASVMSSSAAPKRDADRSKTTKKKPQATHKAEVEK